MVFNKISHRNNQTSKNNLIFLGAPEAEAEALPTSKMPLSKVYVDHHNLFDSLSNEKFIICGRKGSGKSAFAEYVLLCAESEPNFFCKFIRQGESNLEQIVQIGKEAGNLIEREHLFTWVILTNILKLFSDNQAAQGNENYAMLDKFLKKNSGYINIKDSEIKETIKKYGFEISVDYFKRYFISKHSKNFEIKESKAAFYKLIPHLKEVILKVLTSTEERENDNNYVLFFDDLDISFKANDPNSIDSIICLLRITKEINNNFFAKNGLESKVIILLRDDISKTISNYSSDTAKLFSSYSITINWYQDEYNKNDSETLLNIRKFVNTRIKYAYSSNNMSFNEKDPWLSLVEDPFRSGGDRSSQNKTSFKYILEHTFFRPRDLILFFSPLGNHPYQTPITKYDTNQLIGIYSENVIDELKNELFCFYDSNEIRFLFSALGSIANEIKASPTGISYDRSIKIIEENCNHLDPKEIIIDLFNRSFIGNMEDNGFVFFKHREPMTDTYIFDQTRNVVLHHAIRAYCNNRGYSKN